MRTIVTVLVAIFALIDGGRGQRQIHQAHRG